MDRLMSHLGVVHIIKRISPAGYKTEHHRVWSKENITCCMLCCPRSYWFPYSLNMSLCDTQERKGRNALRESSEL